MTQEESRQILDDKICKSLTTELKSWKMTEKDALAYMIFFNALGSDEKLIKTSVENISRKEWIFDNLDNTFKKEDKKSEDLLAAELLRESIKSNLN
jgi:hypothetical protein